MDTYRSCYIIIKFYIIFHPLAPNLFLSKRVEWKKQREKRIDLILGSLSSISFLEKKVQALFMLAFNPAGGSFVSLIDLSKIPIGTLLEGSADKKSLLYFIMNKLIIYLNPGFPPAVSAAWSSSIFSSSFNHEGIRWIFYNMTQ